MSKDADSRPGAGRAERRPRRLPAVLLLAAVAVGGLAYHLGSGYEVLEKGRLLPYTEGKIYKVRLGGWLTLYVEPEVRPSLDLFNAYLLTGVAFIALTFGVILAVSGDERVAARRFFLVAFAGMTYLVADEMLGIHETIGHNLRFLADLPLVKRPDDAVVLLFAAPAALVLFVFRGVLMASRRAVILFGMGLVLFVVSAVADLLTLPIEEPVEVLATLCLGAGMLALGLHHSPGATR